MWYRTYENRARLSGARLSGVGLTGTWILIGSVVMSSGMGQSVATATHPPTPRPCEAEGVCRPSRATWGWNQTRWRPWPGDQAGLQPSVTATPAAEQEAESFQPFERPSPEEEDQRVKPSKKAAQGESTGPPSTGPQSMSPESTAPVDKVVPDLPGSELPALEPELPALELEGRMTPQPIPSIDEVVLQLPAARDVQVRQSADAIRTSQDGNSELRMAGRIASPSPPVLVEAYQETPADIPQPLPETESAQPSASAAGHRPDSATAIPAGRLQDDTPPRLPASLRRLETRLRRSVSTTLPRPIRPNSRAAQLPLPLAGGVVPATWQQATGIPTTGIGLINPAASVSVNADEDELKQAIYYEATRTDGGWRKGEGGRQ